MRNLLIFRFLATVLTVSFIANLSAKIAAESDWDQKKEHRVRISNNTDLPLSISIFKQNSSETIGIFNVGIDKKETKELKISEFYWFETKGLGHGTSSKPAEVLMHGFPNQVTIKSGNKTPQTIDLYGGPYDAIGVSIDENDELSLDHPTV